MQCQPPTIEDIRNAAIRIAGAVEHTPTFKSQTLSNLTGAEVWLKFENLQMTAAYKERGALNKLLQLSEEQRKRGVIASSAGNHAQGLAYHARRLDVPVTIVMPTSTPTIKVTQTEDWGAKVVLFGRSFDEASTHAHQLEDEQGLTFVHPFSDPAVIAGQGTVALEMLEDVPQIDTLIVPIGGGGLMSGMGTAARALKPEIALIGVQAELYPSMRNRLYGGNLPIGGDTLAEGIAVKAASEFTASILTSLVDDIVLVGEEHIERAVALLIGIEKTVVEGAGAAGLAALLAHPQRFQGERVGVVLCGGNIDTRLLANVLVRDLVRSGRMARMTIEAPDRPGTLATISGLFQQANVNIVEIHHHRIFSHLPAKDTLIEIECEARDAQSIDLLIRQLENAEFRVERSAID